MENSANCPNYLINNFQVCVFYFEIGIYFNEDFLNIFLI